MNYMGEQTRYLIGQSAKVKIISDNGESTNFLNISEESLEKIAIILIEQEEREKSK